MSEMMNDKVHSVVNRENSSVGGVNHSHARSVAGQHSEAIAQRKLLDIAHNNPPAQLRSYLKMAQKGLRAAPITQLVKKGSPAGGVVQLAKVKPVMSPAGGKADQVDLNLAVGDTTDVGGSPSVSPPGWTAIQKLGLTKGSSNWKRWVRFHMVNEDQGGPDHVNNLPVTTQKANHDSDWMNLEAELDKAANDPAERPLHFYSFLKYHPNKTVHWKVGRGANKKSVTSRSQDYPSQIYGKLTVKGATVATALLSDSDGAVSPEQLKSVPYATAYDTSGAKITGTKG